MKSKSLITSLFLLFAITFSARAKEDSLYHWKEMLKSETEGKVVARCYYKIGQWYSHKESQLDSSIYFLKKAKNKFEEIGLRRSVGTSYYTMGVSYAHQNDKKNAIKYLTLAEDIFIEVKDTAILFHASLARADQLPAKQKISRLKKIAALAKNHGTIGAEISCYGNIGGGYMELNEYDSAIIYLQKQFTLNNNNNNKRSDFKRKTAEHNAYTCLKLGDAYEAKNDYKQAYYYYKKAYDYSKSISDQFQHVSTAAGNIIILTDKWQGAKPIEYKNNIGDINKMALLREADQVASKSQSYYGAISVLNGFLNYYRSKGNKDSIILYQDKLIAMKDSFYRDEQIEATAKFSEELKTADKEKEIIKLNADKKIASATANRNKIIFILVLVGLLSSIYFIIKRIKYRNLKEQEERDKNFRTKLSSDLHDDVGTILTSLSMQSELLELKTTDGNKGTVGKIADMSRDATRRMRDTVWAIDSRKDNVMDLAYRMIDFADDMLGAKEIEFQLEHNIEGKEDKISAELRQTIFLIFKEAITNAAKYCSGEMVTASLLKGKDTLQLKVQNDTNQKINIDEVSGLGLSNIKKRVADIGGELNLKQDNATFILELSFVI